MTRDEVKGILENVVKEAQKVAKLKSKLQPTRTKLNLVQAGSGVVTEEDGNVQWFSATPSPHFREQLERLQEKREREKLREAQEKIKDEILRLQQEAEEAKAIEGQQQLELKPETASSGIGLFGMMGQVNNNKQVLM